MDQFWLPATIWAPVRTSGLTPLTPGDVAAHGLVIVLGQRAGAAEALPNAARLTLPEITRMTFCPGCAICASTWALAPLPIATIAMTAPTPMMMPSIVSTVRSLFRRSARQGDPEDGKEIDHGAPVCTAVPA